MKKLMAWSLALLVCMLPLAALAQDALAKDETVYALLDAQGAPGSVVVVSHLDTPEDGDYTDYGEYTTLAAMLRDVQPEVSDGVITWSLPADVQGFYAAGEPKEAALPFLVEVAYTLDGEAIAPQDLAGRDGRVQLQLTVTPNPDANPYYADHYAAQVQVPLSLLVASGIDAPGATSALVGRTQTLTYTVMPGQAADFTVSFDAVDFTMGAITIAGAPMDIGGMLDLDIEGIAGQAQALMDAMDGLTEDDQTASEALREMLAGIGALADGAQTLADGVAQMEAELTPAIAAMEALPGQVGQLAEGAQSLAGGMDAYVQGVGELASGTAALSGGLTAVAAQGSALAEGVEGLQTALAQLLPMLPEAQRTLLEGQLEQLSQGVGAYAQAVSGIAEQSGTLAAGAATLSEGGAPLQAGAQSLSAGISAMAEGLAPSGDEQADNAQAADGEGLSALTSGARQLADGLKALREGTEALPEDVYALLDTLQASRDQLASLVPSGEAGDVPSFVSAEHSVRSVQFVYQTSAITKPEPPAQAVEAVEDGGFWQRLLDLFR